MRTDGHETEHMVDRAYRAIKKLDRITSFRQIQPNHIPFRLASHPRIEPDQNRDIDELVAYKDTTGRETERLGDMRRLNYLEQQANGLLAFKLKIALKYFDDFTKRMPLPMNVRMERDKIAGYFAEAKALWRKRHRKSPCELLKEVCGKRKRVA